MGEPMVSSGVERNAPPSGFTPQAKDSGPRFIVSAGWSVIDNWTGRLVAGYIQHRWEAALIARLLETEYAAHERMAEE